MMGALARKLWSSELEVREQRWGTWHPFLPFLGDEVTGKTIAVIGTGRIGQAMIKKCTGFDMNVLCYDPGYQDEKFVEQVQALMNFRHERGLQRPKTEIKYVSLEQALPQADYVSVHVPLIRPGEGTPPTLHLFNERTFRMMKPTPYFFNTSRRPVVDETSLPPALRDSWLAAAALPVD